MKKILRYILSCGRGHRRYALGLTLWLLRQIRDAESDDLNRYSDQLDIFDTEFEEPINLDFTAIEGEYLSSKHAFWLLESAIEDLEIAY